MKYSTPRDRYLLLDSNNVPLAYGSIESPLSASTIEVRIVDGELSQVLEHEKLQLVGMDVDKPSLLGRIITCHEDVITLEKLKSLGTEIRENLRMPVRFESLIYPLDGAWRGCRHVRSHDLSCRGVAFFCAAPLEKGEQIEIVIPITGVPLILKCQILRIRPSNGTAPLFAAKFIDLCSDEERILREAVFNIQLQKRRGHPSAGSNSRRSSW